MSINIMNDTYQSNGLVVGITKLTENTIIYTSTLHLNNDIYNTHIATACIYYHIDELTYHAIPIGYSISIHNKEQSVCIINYDNTYTHTYAYAMLVENANTTHTTPKARIHEAFKFMLRAHIGMFELTYNR